MIMDVASMKNLCNQAAYKLGGYYSVCNVDACQQNAICHHNELIKLITDLSTNFVKCII